MNKVIVYFCLFIIIIIIYYNFKNDNIAYIDNSDKNIDKKSVIISHSDAPTLKKYIEEYKQAPIEEKGGSKPFNNVIIDDNNLISNQVNYNKYESYRRKPLTLNDFQKNEYSVPS